MSWPLLAAREGLEMIKKGARALDVRSSGEFTTGSVPGFRNIAILNDEHRHQVGLTYKQEGNQRAVELGHLLVDPLRSKLVAGWQGALGGDGGIVCCWRGGQRSSIAADWMESSGLKGFRVDGGYKAMRRVLLEEIARPREMVVVGGLTGSGKTDLLRLLEPSRVLDLEGLAAHRGSAFGSFLDQPQPSQQTFENAIGLVLMNRADPLIVENESSMVGRCALPAEIYAGILSASLVRVTASMAERVERVYREYVSDPVAKFGVQVVKKSLLDSMLRISKPLGGVRTQELVGLLEGAFVSGTLESHRAWIEYLFREYYDPRYQFGLTRDERTILFEGDFNSVLEFLRQPVNGG
jgi:tRNA 2-selenouridine synthase